MTFIREGGVHISTLNNKIVKPNLVFIPEPNHTYLLKEKKKRPETIYPLTHRKPVKDSRTGVMSLWTVIFMLVENEFCRRVSAGRSAAFATGSGAVCCYKSYCNGVSTGLSK